jgi:hypothetical protein
MRNFLLAGALGTAMTMAFTAHAQTAEKWGPHIDFEGKPGTKRNLGEADLFVPLWQDEDTLLFGSFRARLDDNDSREGNFGIALRQMQNSGWNLGGYSYFDHRRSPYGNGFNQITLGAEALSFDWDLRANAYLPIGRTSHIEDSLGKTDFSGSTIVYRAGEERAMQGYDAEIGWRVPMFEENAGQQLRLYAGGYRFTDDKADTVQGPRGRLDLTFDSVPFLWEGSRLSLGAEVQHDSPRGTQSFGLFRLRIPLQSFDETPKRKLTAMERRMADPIIRDVDIVSQSGSFGDPEKITETADGKSITLLSDATTTGANLSTAVTSAGANSTVVLNGNYTGVNTKLDLQSGQTIMGAGNLQVKTPSGRTVTITTPAATLSGSGSNGGGGAQRIFDMANNSSLIGVNASLTSALSSAVVNIDSAQNVTITDSTFSATVTSATSSPILINSGTNITLRNNTINSTASGALSNARIISITGTNSNITFANNTTTASGSGSTKEMMLINSVSITNLSGSGNTANVTTCNNSAGTITGNISYTVNGTTHTCP